MLQEFSFHLENSFLEANMTMANSTITVFTAAVPVGREGGGIKAF